VIDKIVRCSLRLENLRQRRCSHPKWHQRCCRCLNWHPIVPPTLWHLRKNRVRTTNPIPLWCQNRTSKTFETKSKTIRPNKLQWDSYVEPYHILRFLQLKFLV
jgi:hypothetical protein